MTSFDEWLDKLSPKQREIYELLKLPQRHTCLVGGTRSGKTFLIVNEIIHRAVMAPDTSHALLRFRANAARASLSAQTIPKLHRMLYKDIDISYLKTEDMWTVKCRPKADDGAPRDTADGDAKVSRLFVAGLDDEYRIEKILGREFSTIFLNEASQIPYESALVAFTRLAEMSKFIEQKLFVDLNPTNKLHWTHRMFVEKRDPVTHLPLDDEKDFALGRLNPHDNEDNLSPAYLASLARLPERQRRRFYEGVYVDAVDHALWTYDLIDRTRALPSAILPEMRKVVVVGVDPSGGAEEGDETGIIVAALDAAGHAYILADCSTDAGALAWPRRAVEAYKTFRADRIVVETNYGGDMAPRLIAAENRNVPLQTVTASRGKVVRAEPIALRYEKGEVHHVGRFPALEEQLCAFATGGYGGAGSPDRADAAVWALTALFDHAPEPGMIGFMRDTVEGEPLCPLAEPPLPPAGEGAERSESDEGAGPWPTNGDTAPSPEPPSSDPG